MTIQLIIMLLAPFALAVLMPGIGRLLGVRTGWVALLAPVISFLAVLSVFLTPAELRTPLVLSWVPQLGVTFTLNPDGLALFFGLVVTGVGVLVTFYSACYLDARYRSQGRFYCMLLLFMGAMLMTVFCGNLLTLFIAWELTGVTSFLLIGFLHEREESRNGARMALLTTGLTGLALLAGVILLRMAYGTFELSEILAAGGVPAGSEGLVTAAFVCCFIGICGKSAQFPFHYWLPNAMGAPTPVSAYLHSATMVKLGVFLTARLLPVFNGLEAWMPVLTVIGFGTLVLGAVLALLSQDLKGVLAYTTVAQLGLLIGYYGLHTSGVPLTWDYLHILNHVFYKACLFMVVGIVDHSVHSRNLSQLGGLFRKMPLTGFTALVGLAALAGLPPTTGFLSKEMLLETVNHFRLTEAGALAWWPVVAVVVASVLKMTVALNVFHRVFMGPASAKVESSFHAPSLALQLPPFLLALAVLGCGMFAGPFGRFLDGFALAGVHAAEPAALHLWHGVTMPVLMSLGIVVAGAVLYFAISRKTWERVAIPRWLSFERLFVLIADGVPVLGKKLNRVVGMENPYSYLFIVLGAIIVATGTVVVLHADELPQLAQGWTLLPASAEGWLRWTLVAIMSFAGVATAVWKHPIRQLFGLSVVGLGIAFYYVLYQAPDLALTQIMVESATLLLVLLVVLRLKRNGADREPMPVQGMLPKAVRLALGAGVGLLMGGGILVFQKPHVAEWAGDYYLKHTLALAHGRNAVNTVVVDFRGWDTLFEITVLVIAALGCLGLLARRSSGRPKGALGAGQSDLFPAPRDFILRMVAIWGFVPLNLFALHIFMRGHNSAGGGFIAGLVTALSLLLLVFVLGVHGVRRWLRFNPITLAVIGVLMAMTTCLVPVLAGLPMLHHLHGHIGAIYVGTPMLFDLGVYCTVVGVTLKLMLPLMKSVHGLPAFVAEENARFSARGDEPIDLLPIAVREQAAKEDSP